MANPYSIAQRDNSTVVVNSVIRNTYLLLSMTLLFSAAMAGLSMFLNVPPLPSFLTLIGYFGLFFLVSALKNSASGVFAVFALTGFMGFTLGPILNMYLTMFSNGGQLVMSALGGTGIIFFALSGYALNAKRDFSYMGGFLVAGSMVMLLAVIASLFLPSFSFLQIGISAGFMLLSAGYILFHTSQIVQGGERNYLIATVSLYLSIYNLFLSLLQLLAMLAGRRD